MEVFKPFKALNAKLSQLKYYRIKVVFFNVKHLFLFVVVGIIIFVTINPNLGLMYKKREELNNLNRQDIRSIIVHNIHKSLDSLEINESNSIDSIFSFINQSDYAFFKNPRAYCCTMILTINLKNNQTLDFEILNTRNSGTMLLLIEDRNHQERLLTYTNTNSSDYMRKLCEKINTMAHTVH